MIVHRSHFFGLTEIPEPETGRKHDHIFALYDRCPRVCITHICLGFDRPRRRLGYRRNDNQVRWFLRSRSLSVDIVHHTYRSDGLGHIFTMIGRDWTHLGVAKLYSDITRNGYKIMYLTSRAIGQADSTRDYLKGVKQNDHQLPEGPVIMSPDRLMTSLHR